MKTEYEEYEEWRWTNDCMEFIEDVVGIKSWNSLKIDEWQGVLFGYWYEHVRERTIRVEVTIKIFFDDEIQRTSTNYICCE